MKEDFFEWLDQCPTEWNLIDTDEDTREYLFFNNDDEDGQEDEDEQYENEEHDYKLQQEQERRENE